MAILLAFIFVFLVWRYLKKEEEELPKSPEKDTTLSQGTVDLILDMGRMAEKIRQTGNCRISAMTVSLVPTEQISRTIPGARMECYFTIYDVRTALLYDFRMSDKIATGSVTAKCADVWHTMGEFMTKEFVTDEDFERAYEEVDINHRLMSENLGERCRAQCDFAALIRRRCLAALYQQLYGTEVNPIRVSIESFIEDITHYPNGAMTARFLLDQIVFRGSYRKELARIGAILQRAHPNATVEVSSDRVCITY